MTAGSVARRMDCLLCALCLLESAASAGVLPAVSALQKHTTGKSSDPAEHEFVTRIDCHGLYYCPCSRLF